MKVILTELNRQPYKNMEVSSGFVQGNSPIKDGIYLKFRHDNPEKNMSVYLTVDEAQAIVWTLSGTVWSWLLSKAGRRKIELIEKEYKALPSTE